MRQGSARVGLAAAVAVAWGSTAARADAPPSLVDLRKLLDGGQYQQAVAGATRVLGMSGPAAGGIDRAAVYAVKGEAHLRLKSPVPAADAFAAAAKATGDLQQSADYKATEVLVRRSKNGVYSPKQPGTNGTRQDDFDVVDRPRRKAAFVALFNDEFAADSAVLKAAESARTVPQLLSAADTALTLRSLELAATGRDDRAKPLLAAVADHARGVIRTGLSTMAKRVADINTAANKSTSYYDNSPSANGAGYHSVRRYRKAGLTSQNVSELKDVVGQCQKITPAVDAFAKATAGDGDAASWDALAAEADRLMKQANDVATADYRNGLEGQK